MRLEPILATCALLACTNSFARSSTQRAEIANAAVESSLFPLGDDSAATAVHASDPMDGSGAVNAVRLAREGGSIPSRGTDRSSAVAKADGRERPAPNSARTDAVLSADLSGVPAESDARSRARSGSAGDDLATKLVRTALAEARWSEADHVALWHVLQRWSVRLGFSLEVAIRVRVERFSRRPPKWIARVQPSCEEPIGWPQRFSWAAHRDRCVELFARAERFLAGELPDPCPRAEGWRAPRVAQVALAMGRVRVQCGKTANVFVRSRG